jgi:hypothetical protein
VVVDEHRPASLRLRRLCQGPAADLPLAVVTVATVERLDRFGVEVLSEAGVQRVRNRVQERFADAPTATSFIPS